MAECTNCNLHKTRKHIVFGKGSLTHGIMLLGEAPGAEENALGLPFVGSAGKVLDAALRAAGILRRDVYIDNVVRCRPPGNRTPSEQELQACQYITNTVIERLQPALIMTLGETPTQHLTGTIGILKHRGMPIKVNGQLYLPTVHPAFVCRQRMWFSIFVADIIKALRLAKEGWSNPLDDVTYDLLGQTIPDNEQEGAYDIETTSLDPYEGEIIGCAICHEPGVATHYSFNDPQQKLYATTWLESSAPKIAQNHAFDQNFLRVHGIKVTDTYFDTMLAQFMLCGSWPRSLTFLASMHTDMPYYKDRPSDATVDSWYGDQTSYVCCVDADITIRVRRELEKELREEDMWDPFIKIVMPASNVLLEMGRRGVKIDQEAAKQASLELKAEYLPIERAFWKKGLNVRSYHDIKRLIKALDLPVPRSVDKENLRNLIRRHPQQKLLQLVLDYREKQKLDSTFVEGLEKYLVDGLLHTHYDVTGTRTGRPASSEPNLNNIPKHIRHIFIPREGNEFAQADYKRLELCVVAAISQDPLLKEDVRERNIHAEVATSLYGKDFDATQYLLAKSIVFGILYGRSARSIARAFNIPVYQAEEYIEQLLHRYTQLKVWRASVRDFAAKHGYLQSVFKRKRYFWEGNVKSQAYNFPIQSAASDVCLTSLIELHEALKGTDGHLVLTVYDSIVIEYPKNERSKYVNIMKEIMERPIPQLGNERFRVDIGCGPNWRDLEEVT